MEDQDKQQNVFAKLWSDLMKAFGFNIGGKKEEDSKKKKSDGDITADNIDGTTAERAAKVATQLMSSLGLKDFQAAGIVGNLLAESGLEAARVQDTPPGQKGLLKVDGRTGYGYAQWTSSGRQQGLWDFAKSKGLDPATQPLTDGVNIGYLVKELKQSYSGVVSSLKSSTSLQEASNTVLFDFESPEDQGPSVQTVRASKGKAVLDKMSAESGGVGVIGNNPLGPITDWSIVDGPDSGYKVNDDLTMHGKEAYLQHKNGFTILPIENNQYSLTNKPQETLSRWQELLGPGQSVIGDKSFAARGTRKKYKSSSDGKMYKNYNDALAAKNSRTNGLGIMQGLMRTYKAGGGNAATAQGGNLLDVMKQGSTNLQAQQKPITPLLKKSESVKQSKDTAPKQLSETDLMMEQYDQLVAAGKQSEAKDLGMKIWNKTYRKTDKGIERISTTPVAATNTTPEKNTQQIIVNSQPQQITQVVVPTPSSGGSTIVVQSTPPIHKQLERMTEKNFC